MVLVLGLAAAVVGWCVIAAVLPWGRADAGTPPHVLRGRKRLGRPGAPGVSSAIDGADAGSHSDLHSHGYAHGDSHSYGHSQDASSAPDCGTPGDSGWGGGGDAGGGGDCGGGGGGGGD